jgi:Domain of unknown function (DUF222)/HNH endonuclease
VLEADMRLGDRDDDDEEGLEGAQPKKPKVDDEELVLDERSKVQRQADALALIMGFFLDHHAKPGSRGGRRPYVNLPLDLKTLESGKGNCWTAMSDHGVYGEVARQMACDCEVIRVLTLGASAVVDVGRATRSVPPALRTALVFRDQRCRFLRCVMPARFTEAHHLIHWVNGGPTNVSNLVLLCRCHHRLVHPGGWTVTGDANHELTFISPTGTHHTTRPPGQLAFTG